MNKELGELQPTRGHVGRRLVAAILGLCFLHCCYNPEVKHMVLSAAGDDTAALEFIKEIKLCEKKKMTMNEKHQKTNAREGGKIPLRDADWCRGQRWDKGCSNSIEMQVVVENICRRARCGMTWRKKELAQGSTAARKSFKTHTPLRDVQILPPLVEATGAKCS